MVHEETLSAIAGARDAGHGPVLARAGVLTEAGAMAGIWQAVFELPATADLEAPTSAEIVAGGLLKDIKELMVSFPCCF